MARVRVRVQPGARSEGVEGWTGDVLRVRVTAPPVGGRANEAVIALLAGVLRIARSRVSITKGAGSRLKTVMIEGLEEGTLRQLLSGQTR